MSAGIPIGSSPRDQRSADCTALASAMHSAIVVDMGTGVSCWPARDSSTAVHPCQWCHACVPCCTVSPRPPPPLLPLRMQFVKAGFAGEACPRACFPNVVGRPVGKRRGGSSGPPVSEVRPRSPSCPPHWSTPAAPPHNCPHQLSPPLVHTSFLPARSLQLSPTHYSTPAAPTTI